MVHDALFQQWSKGYLDVWTSENAVGNLGFALAKHTYSLSAPFPIIQSAMHLWIKRYFALKKLTKEEEIIWVPNDKRL